MVGWFGRLRRRDDRGASLVEFALVMPLLVLLLVGIVEAAWAFANNLDARHGAREGARLVAVDYNPNGNSGNAQRDDIIAEVCSRMDMAGSGASTLVEFTRADLDGNGSSTDVGDGATVTITTVHDDLTGLLGAFGSINLGSTVETRLEQDAGWSLTAVGGDPCP